MLFADFPNSKFWFPEFVSSYAWHVTEIGGSSGIEIIFAPNKFEILLFAVLLAGASRKQICHSNLVILLRHLLRSC